MHTWCTGIGLMRQAIPSRAAVRPLCGSEESRSDHSPANNRAALPEGARSGSRTSVPPRTRTNRSIRSTSLARQRIGAADNQHRGCVEGARVEASVGGAGGNGRRQPRPVFHEKAGIVFEGAPNKRAAPRGARVEHEHRQPIRANVDTGSEGVVDERLLVARRNRFDAKGARSRRQWPPGHVDRLNGRPPSTRPRRCQRARRCR